MDIRHQPFEGALGDTLIERLNSGAYSRFEFMVAFAKQSGVLRLKAALEAFRATGGTVSAFVGIDMGGTSSEALTNLVNLTDELHVVHSESPMQTFHSKVYSLTSATEVWATVGSNNLTFPGLWASFESWVTEVFPLGDARAVALSQRFVAFRDPASGISRKLKTEAEVDDLLSRGYVKTELAINVGTRERQKREPSMTGLFAKIVPHPLGPTLPPGPGSAGSTPSAAVPSPAPVTPTPPSVLAAWVGEVLWAESRAMTGAARNQLDLSMLGRVASGDAAAAGYGGGPNQAVGSVSFFGLDPAAQSTSRNVVINYLGVDYAENLVYFPDSDGANGTWRIQLNGVSVDGARIDHRVGPGGFVQKVLAFQRIDEDYYSLTVLEAEMLSDLALASSFSAHNGGSTSGKLYGVITAAE